MSKARARWVERGPLMHDPYNRKWIYFQAHIEKYTVHRATIDDIMSAFKVTREVAAALYRSGDSPLSGKVLSRTRTREEPPEGDAP